eukprot:CAMPEP_0119005104 /NCGR_PEP_ID=MMETSP1176-20130426/1528_1 /TAXON_ID=265551 /ORGANISM="Synedropsis recta cf, Strain CCMP1620" /LENGTH=561 /DNA_ID=CAMNT_0006956873 /DNA_START=237 /DNA_END=1922 /DNA_ORIENTATION=-
MSSSDWLDQEGTTAGASQQQQQSTMLTASFNQDGGCLAIGTTEGFRIYNLAPFTASVNRPLAGSLGKVEMLFRCNLLALVGGSSGDSTHPESMTAAGGNSNSINSSNAKPYAPAHRVLIWDDHVHKAIGELSFRQVVLSVKLRRDAIAVALRDRIYVYHLSDLSLRDKIYTTDNPHGILSLSTTAVHDMVLCCPSVTDGHVRVELYGLRKTVLLEAHDSKLRAMALTPDGTQLATASTKGTVIRVFSVATSVLLCEFRRGVERVQVTCLSWSWNHEHLACCSEKGTTHVFSVVAASDATKKKKATAASSSSWYDSVRKLGGGDALPHSISQIRGVPHPVACCFVPDLPTTVAVVGWDVHGNGILLLADYSTGEEATRLAYHVLCKATSDDDEALLNEGQQRRKRLMGGIATPSAAATTAHQAEDEGKLYVGERVEVLENQMKEIQFEEKEEGFLNVLGAGGGEEKKGESTDTGDDDDDDDDDDEKKVEDGDKKKKRNKKKKKKRASADSSNSNVKESVDDVQEQETQETPAVQASASEDDMDDFQDSPENEEADEQSSSCS